MNGDILVQQINYPLHFSQVPEFRIVHSEQFRRAFFIQRFNNLIHTILTSSVKITANPDAKAARLVTETADKFRPGILFESTDIL